MTFFPFIATWNVLQHSQSKLVLVLAYKQSFFFTLLCRSRSKLLLWYRKTIDQSDLRINTVVDVNTVGLQVTA